MGYLFGHYFTIAFFNNKFIMLLFDGLVKSHIPYVVHASTKPVLSEPSTRRQAQGERWVEALSTNGISIGYTVRPEPVEG